MANILSEILEKCEAHKEDQIIQSYLPDFTRRLAEAQQDAKAMKGIAQCFLNAADGQDGYGFSWNNCFSPTAVKLDVFARLLNEDLIRLVQRLNELGHKINF